ncbi:glycerol-3-phosphate 1-O-acyltransferase PlsY [Paenibacillus sp. JJ-223]|uniref:glycerol-3-phosphate 1-O-acyltransferase PlsY n=1 Tax=Paenibacillus sp. JJ-223 TaxID=2905647 RepID=UPI001F353979|nr:glycerol-3-phosphate 1-O-acyltransferase PlsY [Paenibacillus sp. JJ-223]CAH1217503.1 Glycerol-3-phosphate acyltransferase [Paenibacillus sp. JJ-223]
MILQIAAIVLSYLLGSISFSVLLAKAIRGIDIRQHGSGNAGATNTLRILGKGPAILVLLLDVVKGIVAVWLGIWLGNGSEWTPAFAGIAAIAGHNWPLYFRFRGGKGIATAIGVLATLAFPPALCAGIIAILSIVFTRYVSLGSLIFVALTPIFILVFPGYSMTMFWGSLIICLFAFWRHRTNIVKLAKGQENKLGSKSAGGGKRVV